MYCLWPPHYYTLGVHVYCLWPLPHVLLYYVWSSYNKSVYNNNIRVYYNSGSSSGGLHSDLYRFCYSTLGIPVLYPDSVYYLRSATGIVWT